ncbi:MAG: B12-binding domain-containing radical SAM protein [Marinilabiliaceae bacterium]|nr:B12-binding domain-containing radical SAM protein [Marinilabiliaceae bacterium]
MDTEIKIRMSPPLGLYTIVNVLRGAHSVVVENENIESIEYDKPDVVGITITLDALPRAIEIARAFRRRGVPVVAGGIHVTTAPNHVPKDEFDAICIGAAEWTWPQIVADIESGSLKPVYKCDRRFSGSDIVPPAYDLIPRGKYLYRNIIHTSRGCPFKCDFCYNSFGEHRFMHRDKEDVLNEIKMLGQKHIMIIDDNFIGDPRWTMGLLRDIIPLEIKWNAAVSINVVNIPGMLDLMKESGCQGLFIGFESINTSSLDGVHKVQNDRGKFEYAISEIHRRGIMINASFVFGIDSDTPDVFRRTVDWIVSQKIETITSHILTPYPGTKLYDEFARDGRLTTTDLSLYNTAHVVFKPQNMTAEQLYEGYLYVYRELYSFKNILRRLPRARSQWLAYLTFNLLYRKFGRVSDWLCRRVTYERIGWLGEKLARYI